MLRNEINKKKDTLLNVFLAIAVDNLANAQEMTAREEEEARLAQELKERCLKNEITMFTSPEGEEANEENTNKDAKVPPNKENKAKDSAKDTKDVKENKDVKKEFVLLYFH